MRARAARSAQLGAPSGGADTRTEATAASFPLVHKITKLNDKQLMPRRKVADVQVLVLTALSKNSDVCVGRAPHRCRPRRQAQQQVAR